MLALELTDLKQINLSGLQLSQTTLDGFQYYLPGWSTLVEDTPFGGNEHLAWIWKVMAELTLLHKVTLGVDFKL